jgi:hypothetical protein
MARLFMGLPPNSEFTSAAERIQTLPSDVMTIALQADLQLTRKLIYAKAQNPMRLFDASKIPSTFASHSIKGSNSVAVQPPPIQTNAITAL